MCGECRQPLRVLDGIAAQALQDDEQGFLDEVLEEPVIATGASAEDYAQTGLELADQLAFCRAIPFANTSRQLSARNEIHTLSCP